MTGFIYNLAAPGPITVLGRKAYYVYYNSLAFNDDLSLSTLHHSLYFDEMERNGKLALVELQTW